MSNPAKAEETENHHGNDMHQSTEELLATFVEVEINSSDEFLKVRETLTRMGISKVEELYNPDTGEEWDEKALFQSCHILHKRGKYYIVHFKELFMLDGKPANMSEEDYARRNTIAKTLERWGLLKIISQDNAASPILGGRSGLTIIPFKEKNEWDLVTKYTIGANK